MKIKTADREFPCDSRLIEEFLEGSLSNPQIDYLTRHLDNCEACGRELENLAADSANWSEAKSLLAKSRTDLPEIESAVRTSEPLPLPARQVLDFLNPTDDPASLGRLDCFEVLGVVGCGAMGVVLKAYDRSLDRIVALKVMHPSLATSGTARQRFAREARAAAGVLHNNVVAIHGVSTSSKLPYLMMPYLKGPSLQQRIDSEGPMSLAEILRIGSQIAAGLSAAHKEGLIHRDVKPANIMLDAGVETVVLTDFGLARTIDDATMTRSGVITGTPEFMSPEQARGDSIDFSSDVFSLGSVLYVLCCGRLPFRASTAFGVLRRISDESPEPIRSLNPEIPVWLCEIIGRLQSKSPNLRPSAEDTQCLLQGCLAHVYQPDRIPLPEQLVSQKSFLPSILFVRSPHFGIPVMTMLFLLIALTYVVVNSQVGDEPVSKNETENLDEISNATVADTDSKESIYQTLNVEFPNPSERGLLEIDINRGFVEVAVHDQPGVIIEILNPKSKTNAGDVESKIVQQFAPQYDFDIVDSKNQIKLGTYNVGYLLNLRIKVPKRTNLSLATYRDGYLEVKEVDGEIHAHSQNSDIRLLGISGTATAFSYNGNITTSFVEVSGAADLDFESYNGSVDLTLPKAVKSTTIISTGRGSYGTEFEISYPSEFPESIQERMSKLSNPTEYRVGLINGGGLPIRIETEKGNITLRCVN